MSDDSLVLINFVVDEFRCYLLSAFPMSDPDHVHAVKDITFAKSVRKVMSHIWTISYVEVDSETLTRFMR